MKKIISIALLFCLAVSMFAFVPRAEATSVEKVKAIIKKALSTRTTVKTPTVAHAVRG
jgi:hypothetical protein